MDTDLILSITSAILFMGVLGLTLSTLLALANRKLWVFGDPRIDEIEEMLPSTNCGACGTAGCRPFAEALLAGKVQPGQCTVNTSNDNEEIAGYLGVDAGDIVKRVARLACAGGTHVARMRAHYDGLGTCRAAAAVAGGPKACAWGCLGLGDCAEVCDFDAITLDRHGLPVVDNDKCTACDDCVEICPKGLFSIQPVTHRLWIACKNQMDGDAAEADCEVACTNCERCAKDSPEGLINIVNNLAVIDYEKNDLASPLAADRCPTGAIVWLEGEMAVKGSKAKRIVREEALPLS
jgi:Na+-translocating ferredoxin:NAD+ oxidoreductase RNF subunit RnfB